MCVLLRCTTSWLITASLREEVIAPPCGPKGISCFIGLYRQLFSIGEQEGGKFAFPVTTIRFGRSQSFRTWQ